MSEKIELKRAPSFGGEAERVRYGGCTCGTVRFEVHGEPTRIGLCHCTTCRKATGAVAMAYADWPVSAFSRSGFVRTYEGRSFCAKCGSRLFELDATEVEIVLGAFDDAPGDLTPGVEGWIKRREHWLAPIDGAAQFEEDPSKA